MCCNDQRGCGVDLNKRRSRLVEYRPRSGVSCPKSGLMETGLARAERGGNIQSVQVKVQRGVARARHGGIFAIAERMKMDTPERIERGDPRRRKKKQKKEQMGFQGSDYG